MEYFMLAVSVVLPLFVYMLVGVLIKHLGILGEENLKAVNRMIFNIMIPLALFFSVYRADLKSAVKPGLYVYVWVSVIAVFGLVWVFLRRCRLDGAVTATMVQGMFRSNFVLFGVTIAASLCDERGVASIAALSAIVVPTFNILTVILFETARGGKVPVGKLLIGIFMNPLVGAGVLGIAVGLLEIRLPELVAEPLEKLGEAATPLALVVLGGLLSAKSISGHRYHLAVAALAKLVVIPFVTVCLGILAGFRGNDLVAVLAVFASPTAVASTPMAQAMGGDGKLAGEIVAVTSVGCILTMFLWVFVLAGVGYIA